MSYFRNFSDFLYQSPLVSRNSSYDYVRAKNIFRRAKIREDIFQSSVAFEKYKVIGNERPDQVAQKIYGSAEYDWVVLLSNNIINIRDEWPLSDSELSNYLLTKYTETELSQVHHYETKAQFDIRGKLIVPAGKIVDSDFTVKYYDESIAITQIQNVSYSFDSNQIRFDSSIIRFNSTFEQENSYGGSITIPSTQLVRSVSIYEYETQKNDEKRNIFVLQPRYLQTIIDDFKDIMSYDESSQYVDTTTKRGDNLRIISPR